MDNPDWRLKATGTTIEHTILPWSGHIVEKGARIKLVSVIDLAKKKKLTIPVPDLTALYVDSSAKAWEEFSVLKQKYKITSSLRKEVSFPTDESAIDAIENIAISVITAYSSIEAFCNSSIPDDHEYWHLKRSKHIFEKSDKKEIERYFSTAHKLNQVLPSIFRVDPPKGKSPVWVSYKALKESRDALIHAKSDETRSGNTSKINLWEKLFKIRKPYLLAKDVFQWFLKNQGDKPMWYKKYPD